MLKKLFGDAAIYGLASQVSKVAGIFALPIITPHLTKSDYGIMGVITAYSGIVLILQNLGLNIIISNSFYHHRNHYKWVWRQIYGFLFIWYVPFYLLLGLLLYFIIPEAASAYTWEIILLTVIPGILFGPAITLGAIYYQLHQNPIPIAVRSIIFSLITIALNVYLIAYVQIGFRGWIISNAVVAVLTNISYWYPLRFRFGMKPIYAFRWRYWKSRFGISIPMMPHYYSMYLLNSSDQVVMEQMGESTADIGRYNFPARFGNYFSTLVGAFTTAIAPMLMASYKAGEEAKAKFLVYNFQLMIFFCTFTFCLWAKEIFQLLINNPALESTYSLAIPIVMGYNYRAMYVGANTRLFFYERTKVLWKITLIAGLSNVVLNILLIPHFGIEVAAVTTFISLMYMGYAGFYIKDYKELTSEEYYPMRWLFATVSLSLLAYYSVDLGLLNKIFIHISVLGALGIAFLSFKKSSD